ncbi:hypothetical protein M8542_47570 [Amycolatopsis sp. OK19-0408]|uniref:Uncharacterized protein n=1 Tax=Amycolatopsis iheyensis TaxID=2945988 RepID=A0A9X2NP62_9PSEU|nr:hypothetical protein [Amycolatopsis iheyensis]MCR6490489.1 hypothetical protein [Amycolatopsis iheyensis]
MVTSRSKGSRVVALAVAVVLIVGGATGLAAGNHPVATTIGSAAAILAGLFFLRVAARKS